MLLTLVFAGATFFSTMSGGIAAIRWPARLELLMALAGGVVLGAAIFDLIPEAVEHAEEAGLATWSPYAMAVAAYFGFRLLEDRLHRHDHSHGPGRMGVAGAAGFTVHSFFDGLAIGLGFHIDEGVGIVVALAVIGHDFSDGLNTVSYLIAHGHDRARQWRWLIACAAAPLAGALVGGLVPVPDEVFPLALGFFSGVFVYAASTNLLPRARRARSRRSSRSPWPAPGSCTSSPTPPTSRTRAPDRERGSGCATGNCTRPCAPSPRRPPGRWRPRPREAPSSRSTSSRRAPARGGPVALLLPARHRRLHRRPHATRSRRWRTSCRRSTRSAPAAGSTATCARAATPTCPADGRALAEAALHAFLERAVRGPLRVRAHRRAVRARLRRARGAARRRHPGRRGHRAAAGYRAGVRGVRADPRAVARAPVGARPRPRGGGVGRRRRDRAGRRPRRGRGHRRLARPPRCAAWSPRCACTTPRASRWVPRRGCAPPAARGRSRPPAPAGLPPGQPGGRHRAGGRAARVLQPRLAPDAAGRRRWPGHCSASTWAASGPRRTASPTTCWRCARCSSPRGPESGLLADRVASLCAQGRGARGRRRARSPTRRRSSRCSSPATPPRRPTWRWSPRTSPDTCGRSCATCSAATWTPTCAGWPTSCSSPGVSPPAWGGFSIWRTGRGRSRGG